MNIEDKRKVKPIKIFSTGNKGTGLNVVKSPVKLSILALLEEGEMDFDNIVKILDKSKSTISVHLKSLQKEGVVSYRQHKDDKRKKTFYINSKFLGSIKPPEPIELPEQKIDFLVKNLVESGNDFEFARLMFHTLRATLIQEGLNLDPLMYETGLKIGLAIYNNLKDDDYNTFLSNIANFWNNNGLGNITVEEDGDIIKITSTDCFECGFLPKTGKPACFLDLGIIEALLSSYIDDDIEIIETKCYTMGDECCLFEIKKPKIEIN
jgi:predicted hydrocarbon binding protein